METNESNFNKLRGLVADSRIDYSDKLNLYLFIKDMENEMEEMK